MFSNGQENTSMRRIDYSVCYLSHFSSNDCHRLHLHLMNFIYCHYENMSKNSGVVHSWNFRVSMQRSLLRTSNHTDFYTREHRNCQNQQDNCRQAFRKDSFLHYTVQKDT